MPSLRPMRPRPLPATVLLALAACSLAAAQGRPLQIPELGVQLVVPRGWAVLESIPGVGVHVGQPGEAAQGLDILSWEPVSQALSSTLAANAHERLLGRQASYRRTAATEFVAADGRPALLVTGEVQGLDAGPLTSVFAAYVMGGRYWVLGAFGPAREVAALRARYLDEAVRTFSPAGTDLAAVSGSALPRPTVTPPSLGPVAVAPTRPVAPIAPDAGTGPGASPLPAPQGAGGIAPVAPGGTPPAAGSTRITPALPEPPEPPPVARPIPPVAPLTPEPVVAVTPVTPAPTTPVAPVAPVTPTAPVTGPTTPSGPPAPALVRDPAGFELRLPAGWTASLQERIVVITETAERPRMTAYIAPVAADSDVPPAERLAAVAPLLAARTGLALRPERTREAPGPSRSVITTGVETWRGAKTRWVLSLTPGAGVDLVQLALATTEALPADRRVLAEIIASFQCAPLKLGKAPAPTARPWTDSARALALQIEDGWRLAGGVQLYNGLPVIELWGTHPETGAAFSWRQPELPCYKDLTPQLLSAGWKEGDGFAPDRGTDPLSLRKRTNSADVARQRALESEGMAPRALAPVPPGAALLPGSEGARASAVSATQAAVAICAVSSAPPDFGPGAWMVASLKYQGPLSTQRAAGVALRRVLESAQVSRDWFATGEERAALQAALDGAREAAGLLPDADLPAGINGPQLLLGGAPVADEGARSLNAPATAAVLWRLATDINIGPQALPELFGR